MLCQSVNAEEKDDGFWVMEGNWWIWRRIVGDQRLGEWKMAKGGMRTTARGGML